MRPALVRRDAGGGGAARGRRACCCGSTEPAPAIAARPLRAPLTLEIVTGADAGRPRAGRGRPAPRRGLTAAAGRRAAARAISRAISPRGPGPTGADADGRCRAAAGRVSRGRGRRRHADELHRVQPLPPGSGAVDFATFGTTAIVHAADDASVLETLEALRATSSPARGRWRRDRPLRLGLMSIGMRSNPYGAAVAANPDGRAAADGDGRSRASATGFARGLRGGGRPPRRRGAGVASFAPAMTGGPLGLRHATARSGRSSMSSRRLRRSAGPRSRSTAGRRGAGGDPRPRRRGVRGVAANLGPDDAEVAAPAGPRADAGRGAAATLAGSTGRGRPGR